MSHRGARNAQQQATAAKKARESAKVGERAAELQASINDEKRQSSARVQGLQAELKTLKASSGRTNNTRSHKSATDSVIVSASSCGRVKTVSVPKKGNNLNTLAAPQMLHEYADAGVAPLPGDTGIIPRTDALMSAAPSSPFVSSLVPSEFSPSSAPPIPAFDFTSSQSTSGFGSRNYNSSWNIFDVANTVPAVPGPHFDHTGFTSVAGVSNLKPLGFPIDDIIHGTVPASTETHFEFPPDDSMAFPPTEVPPGLEDFFGLADFVPNPYTTVNDEYNWSIASPTELPRLPAPPASSPLKDFHAPSPEPPISAKARGKRKEVDEANILSTRRTCIRRTRSSDNQICAPPSKKATS
ncbi:hypothetical protein C8R44DRAFT_865547 [Mycena epipterygia]|nr:hypothetical protein C8R44DRAFT_865547 [Mycena epipterygia]